MKKYIIIIIATTSIIHAAEQEPSQSWHVIDGNTPLTIAPYLITHQPDEFDIADTSSLMTIKSDDYLMSTPHNNDMHTADNTFISIEQEQLEVPYIIDPSFIPQLALAHRDHFLVVTASSTIAKVVEKLQERRKKGKRDMKDKKFSCSHCHWSTDNENSMEEHEFTNKHRDNAGLPRVLWHEKKYPCEICRVGFHRTRDLEKHNKREPHLKKMVELMNHCPSF